MLKKTAKVYCDRGVSWTRCRLVLVAYLSMAYFAIPAKAAVSTSGDVVPTSDPATWVAGTTVYIGQTDTTETATLDITSGSDVTNGTGNIGYASGVTGEVTVDGAGSTWTHSNSLYVGKSGNGTLNILNGATVAKTGINNNHIAAYTGSTGTVVVNNATWTNNHRLYIGGSDLYSGGDGTLSISNGGNVTNSENCYIAYRAGTDCSVTVDGTGSTWTNSNSLYIGRQGEGTLNITDGGSVTANNGYIASHDNSTGVVVVNNATWTNQNLYMGGSDTTTAGDDTYGTLSISNDGDVTSSGSGYIAYGPGTDCSVTVDGSGSTWEITGAGQDLHVGRKGYGTLNITNGGAVSVADDSYIASHDNSTGVVVVNNATWTNGGVLYLGGSGTLYGNDATLSISNGGDVSSGEACYIAYRAGTDCSVTVAGPGSTLSVDDDLYVGRSGTGTLEIIDHGLVVVDGTLTIDNDNDNDSFIKMATDGQLAIPGDYDVDLATFLAQISGNDDIRCWQYGVGGGSWEDITDGTLDEDFTLEYINDNEDPLDGYTVLTALGTFIAGDANRDGEVDSDDYDCVQANFGNVSFSRDPGLLGDANGDGRVSAGDYGSIQANWGDTIATGTPIPEPATMALLSVGGIALLKRGRK